MTAILRRLFARGLDPRERTFWYPYVTGVIDGTLMTVLIIGLLLWDMTR